MLQNIETNKALKYCISNPAILKMAIRIQQLTKELVSLNMSLSNVLYYANFSTEQIEHALQELTTLQNLGDQEEAPFKVIGKSKTQELILEYMKLQADTVYTRGIQQYLFACNYNIAPSTLKYAITQLHKTGKIKHPANEKQGWILNNKDEGTK